MSYRRTKVDMSKRPKVGRPTFGRPAAIRLLLQPQSPGQAKSYRISPNTMAMPISSVIERPCTRAFQAVGRC